MKQYPPQNSNRSGVISWCQSQLRRVPAFFVIGKNIRYLLFALVSGLWPALRRGFRNDLTVVKAPHKQWNVALPSIQSAAALADWLREQGVLLIDAEHTLYVPPHETLEKVLPEIARFYPAGSGFKILKDLRPPEKANYLAGRAGSVAVRRWLTGSPAEQMITANYMHALGIGPRVWDVCRWSGNGTELTVFVVEHIEGSVPDGDACQSFLDRLSQLVSDSYLRILIMNWELQDDFECPGCRDNLFHSADHDSLQYVDFQNFRLSDPADWMRATAARAVESTSRPIRRRFPPSHEMFAELTKVGVNIQDRVVIQVDCGLGESLGAAISLGAAWGLGWTTPKLRDRAESYLYSQGFGRFTIFPADDMSLERLDEQVSPGIRQRLSDSVMLCHFDEENVGELSPAVRSFPWQTLVCCSDSGHLTTEEIVDRLREGHIDGRHQSTISLSDANGQVCSFAVLSRKQPS